MSLDNLSQYERTNINSRITDKDANQKANIVRSSEQRPKMALRLVLPLDTAVTAENPKLISQPFNGYYIENRGTDTDAYVRLALVGLDKYVTDNYTEVGKNDSSYSYEEIKNASLAWPAQPGKTLTIIFFLGVDFRPGSLISAISGGVTIVEGTSISESLLSSTGAASSVPLSGTIAQLLIQDDDRKTATLYNDGADAWIGGAAVVSGTGDFWPSNSWKIIRNTAAIYAITAGGASLVTGTVEK